LGILEDSNINLSIGDYFSGVLLELFQETRTNRPRVRPIKAFSSDVMVEFPRNLRERHPIGTQFRATVKVCQKHGKDGSLRGQPYLRAVNDSIQLEKDYSPVAQIFAIPKGDRKYSFEELESSSHESSLNELRSRAYSEATLNVPVSKSETQIRKRSVLIRTYALERSRGVCEGCFQPAPFSTKNSMPYIEVHHLTPVSQGGADHPMNVAAVCPNCHRRTEKSEDADAFNEAIREYVLEIESRTSLQP
jgi:5-methylcytosine-specific restriction endonuclease McrA